MSSLQGRFSFLLVCGIQLITQTLLQGAGVDAAALDSFTTQTPCLEAPIFSYESNKSFAFKSPSLTSLDVLKEVPPLTATNKEDISQRTLSVALFPLDCLGHMALSVLKSPLLFLAATSALPSETQGDDIRYRMLEKRYRQKHPRVTLGLTADWDTYTCKGRALHNQTHTMQLKKIDCRMDACLTAVRHSTACNPPESERLAEGGNFLNLLCDRAACAPYAINLGFSPDIPKNTNNCTKEACLRTKRFVPDEMKEVSPGVFKTLEQLGEDAIQDCKEVRPYKRHCH